MKTLFQISLLFWLAATANAQNANSAAPPTKVLQTFDWKNLPLPSTNCQIVSSVLKIENTNGKPLNISLLTITNSSLLEKALWASCDIKYENVGDVILKITNPLRQIGHWGYPVRANLALLDYVPPLALGGDTSTNNSTYFISGTANWEPKEFTVNQGAEKLPIKFEFKLSLPTNGTVYLRPIKFVGYASSSYWWTKKQSDTVGGAVGIFGGVIGCFCGLLGNLASKGKARQFVMASVKTLIALGIVLTLIGIAAILCGQPFFVWNAFLLPGVLVTVILSTNLPLLQRRYDDLELRRMNSMDAMGS